MIAYLLVKEADKGFWRYASGVKPAHIKVFRAKRVYQGIVKIDEPTQQAVADDVTNLKQHGLQAFDHRVLLSKAVPDAPRIKIPDPTKQANWSAVALQTSGDANDLANRTSAIADVHGVGVVDGPFQVLAVAWGQTPEARDRVVARMVAQAGVDGHRVIEGTPDETGVSAG